MAKYSVTTKDPVITLHLVTKICMVIIEHTENTGNNQLSFHRNSNINNISRIILLWNTVNCDNIVSYGVESIYEHFGILGRIKQRTF